MGVRPEILRNLVAVIWLASACAPAPDPPDREQGEPPDAGGDGFAGCDGACDDAQVPGPGVGLLHTAAELDTMRQHRDQEPWATAFAALLQEADAALAHPPAPLADLSVPAYYDDPAGHEAAKQALSDDAFAAYACALAFQLARTDAQRAVYANKAIEILDAWATVNTRVSGADGSLVMMYKGIHLVYAADLVAGYPGWGADAAARFRTWVATQFASSADEKKTARNNHGAWGTLGAMAAAAYLGDGPALDVEIERLRARIRDEIDANGELPEENKRTNSGIWYTYFALAPMTGAAQLARNVRGLDLFDHVAANGRSLRLALDRLFFYAEHPDAWPHHLPDGLAGELWRLLYPCADELELPTPNSWPGNLFEAMASEYGVGAWSAWVEPYRPQRGGHIWIYPTLTRPNP